MGTVFNRGTKDNPNWCVGYRKSDTPWLDDDAIVRKLINDLEEPISFMFYLCNRFGLRTGEAAGLRMSDTEFIKEGVLRVRFSYDGPPKEDKKGEGKVKWVPAPEDCAEFLGAWLEQRKAQGKVVTERKPKMTWYQATRHSFVSRHLSGGASLDEVRPPWGSRRRSSRSASTTTMCVVRSRRSCARVLDWARSSRVVALSR